MAMKLAESYKAWPRWARITVPVVAGLVAVGGYGAATGSGDEHVNLHTPSSTTVVASTTERQTTTTVKVTTTTTAPTTTTTTVPPTTMPASTAPPTTAAHVAPTTTQPASVYYANCDAARAAGAAPLHRGDPGYRSGLDRDNDGIACE
jgi:hypothetical protein